MLELLRLDNFYNESEFIEIAKGKNKLPETLSEGFKQLKRQVRWQKRK
jgi:hypothetical protein